MNKKILKLSIPSILASITVPLVGLVDLAVAGRIGSAAAIGALAMGSMLFDLLYWNFGFLRVGTAGLTAQAYGKRNFSEAIKTFSQSICTSVFIGVVLIAIQYLFLNLSFCIIECSPEVEALARDYFKVRIWAAPATLSLFVFRGWFMGMQNAISPMVIDIGVNVINLVLSIYFALYLDMGVKGVAAGTLAAQYTGLVAAIIIVWVYYGKLFKYFDLSKYLNLKDILRVFKLNRDLFLRSLCFMLIYSGFTYFSAKYGDEPLAVTSIIMKLLLLFSYLVDGFAYAGEALVGKYIGAKNVTLLRKAVRLLFIWSLSIGAVSTLAYYLCGDWMVSVITTSESVRAASEPFMFWLLLMPIISCAAFMWDGVFIGATASKEIRDCMFFSAVAFLLVYYLFKGSMGIQALMLAYFAHLAVRTVYLSIMYKKKLKTWI